MKIMAFIFLGLLLGMNVIHEDDSSYEKLWEEVKAFEKQNLPQSAYKVVEKIYEKAKKENNDPQLIKAIIYKSKLLSAFEDLDPAEYISRFVQEHSELDTKEGKALYASLLGELFYQYGLNNMDRLQNRSPIASDTEVSNDLKFATPKTIQLKSIAYYIESVGYISEVNIGDYRFLLEEKVNVDVGIEAHTIREFLLMRAIRHFSNSSSFVTIPTEKTIADFSKYLSPIDSFLSEEINQESAHYDNLTLRLYQELLRQLSDDAERQKLVDLKRLQYVHNKMGQANRGELYHDILKKELEQSHSQLGTEYIYYLLIQHHLSYRDNGLHDKEQVVDNLSSANLLLKDLHEKYGNSLKLKSKFQHLEERLHKKEIRIATETVVEPHKAFLAQIEYLNVPACDISIYSLSEAQYPRSQGYLNKNQQIELLNDLKPISTKSYDLKGSEDFVMHSTEIGTEPLDYGFYILCVQTKGEKKLSSNSVFSYVVFQVSDLAIIENTSQAIANGYVIDRQSGSQIPDVNIEVLSQDRRDRNRQDSFKSIGNVVSNAEGAYEIRLPKDNYRFRLSKGKDIYYSGLQYNYGGSYNNRDREIVNYHVFTDRAIYRPSQNIEFKILAIRGDANKKKYSVIPDKKIKVELTEGYGRSSIAQYDLKTNEYGSTYGTFLIPSEINTGVYSILVDGQHVQTIRIEEYKRPKIFAKMDNLDRPYIAGDTINVQCKVESFSGAQVSNAKVQYTVYKKRYRNYWCGYRYPVIGNNMTPELMAQGQGSTDETGRFELSFASHALSTDRLYMYYYEVTTEVVDITGERTQAKKSIYLNDSPLRLDFQFPNYVFRDQLPNVELNVVNVESEAVEADIDIKISKLRDVSFYTKERLWSIPDMPLLSNEEYKERFPLERIDLPEDLSNYEVESEMGIVKKSSGEFFDELGDLASGLYRLKFKAVDSLGYLVEQTAHINIVDKSEELSLLSTYYIKSNKEIYAPGDTFELTIASGLSDLNVFMYLSKDGKLIEKEVLNVNILHYKFPIKEEHRGGLSARVITVKDNRLYQENLSINVPWRNKELEIKCKSFRDKVLPGQSETHELSIVDHNGETVDAELTACMYDSSLDQFVSHNWRRFTFPMEYDRLRLTVSEFGSALGRNYVQRISGNGYLLFDYMQYFNWFGYRTRGHYMMRDYGMMEEKIMLRGAPQPMMAKSANSESADLVVEEDESTSDVGEQSSGKESDKYSVRENLEETVFFYPQLSTVDGKIKLNYTNNEALTKWKMMLLAHTKDMAQGHRSHTLVTQKPLIIEPQLPRYFRQGDTIVINAKVTNLSDSPRSVNSRIEIAESNSRTPNNLVAGSTEIISELEVGESKNIEWIIGVPDQQIEPLIITMLSESDGHSDGEKNIIPVLSNRKLVTETLAMHIPAKSDKSYKLSGLEKMRMSETIIPHKLSVEVTSDPSWMVLKSLPALTDADEFMTENIMHGIYALKIGQHLVSGNPSLAETIRKWNGKDGSKSNLSKNEDLKISSIELTPWLADAQYEEDNMRHMNIFIDKNKLNYSLDKKIKSLQERQGMNGGFSWCKSGRSNWYVTQNILQSIGQLNSIGVNNSGIDQSLIESAINYIDKKLLEYHKDQKKPSISHQVIQYLYVRSLFSEIKLSREVEKVKDIYLKLAQEEWTKYNTHEQTMLALASWQIGDKDFSKRIYTSLIERMIVDDEQGAYWNDLAGYYTYKSNIGKQAMLIELFQTLNAKQDKIELLQQWLLKQKQVSSWQSTKETASAVHSYMGDKSGDMDNSRPVDIYLGDNNVVKFDNPEYLTGYARKDWSPEKFPAESVNIRAHNTNEHLAWGGAYVQYFEDLDKITDFDDTPLKVSKELFKIEYGSEGVELKEITDNSPLMVGDKVRVRITLRADRRMEYVQMRDIRSSGLEPINILSEYKWQGGLGYYESTKDMASYFYFDVLPKGHYVFEYDVYARHKGKFSNGITELQSMYAPEFSSHSEGVKLTIE